MPAFSFYEEDSTPSGGTLIDGSNPVALGQVDKGTVSPIVTIHVWNHKNNPGGDTSLSPRLYATNGSGDASLIFNGTAFNGLKSMLEARSCDSYGVPADKHQEWTPISPLSLLTLGDMPANTMRTIELRMNVPVDAPDLANTSFSLRIST